EPEPAGLRLPRDLPRVRDRGRRLPLRGRQHLPHVVRTGRHYSPRVDTQLSSQEFEGLVEEAIASVPEPLAKVMSNVGVIIDEQASPWQSVLGLYQGIPLTQRNTAYAGALPDKITIFR